MAFASLNGVYSKDSGAGNIKDLIERTLTKIEIPRGVSKIGFGAYMSCDQARGAVNVPEGVTRIEGSAFYACRQISEMNLPKSLEYVGTSAFVALNSIDRLVLPPLVYMIYASMASEAGFSKFVAEGDIYSIAGNAFSNCTKCTSYDFTSCTKVPTLANINAFNNINPDADIFVPSELYDEWTVATNWAKYADHIVGVGAGNYGLLDFTLNDDCESFSLVDIGTYDSMGELTDLIIPEKHEGLPVTVIASDAFGGMDDLGRVTIPESIERIEAAAFQDCGKLEYIYFGAAQMADCAYSDGVFARAGHSGDGISVVIGKEVDVVPANLFYGGFPMGDYSPKVTSVEFEEGSICRTIGDQAFYYCLDLTELKAPATLEQIGTCALFHADVLDFSDCTRVPTLKSADLGARTIYVPAALYDQWIVATNWAQYANKIVAK